MDFLEFECMNKNKIADEKSDKESTRSTEGKTESHKNDDESTGEKEVVYIYTKE